MQSLIPVSTVILGLAALVGGADIGSCATITATVTAETIPYGAIVPDCIQTSTGAYVTCQTSGAGSGGSAGGGFDSTYNQGSIQMNIGADRIGAEQAKASATITFDGTFVTDFTGPVTGTYEFNIGQFWMDPPEILISQDGMSYTAGARYLHNVPDKMITANATPSGADEGKRNPDLAQK